MTLTGVGFRLGYVVVQTAYDIGAMVSNIYPFKTGNTAFRLGIAKALVPFVFVYSPSLLLVADGFTWSEFATALIGAMLGIGTIGTAFAGYLIAPLKMKERWWIAIVSFLFIAPGLLTMAIGLLLLAPIAVLQIKRRNGVPVA